MKKVNRIMRLARPRPKGLIGLVFSRAALVAVLIVAQILMHLALFFWFRQYLPHYTVIQAAFTFGMTIYLFNSGMDSTAKLTWLMLIAVLPLAGAALLLYTRTNLGHRRVQRLVEQRIDETRGALPQDAEVLERLRGDAYGMDDLHRYVNRSGCFPICGNTEVTYYRSGEDKFAALMEEIEKAERYIFLEYFIIEEGYMWGRILKTLVRKAKKGVDVRVLYDGTCEFSKLPHDYARRLEAVGIKTKVFSPLRPLLSTHYNYRDHRKILVVDGRVAFNGGVNLADEYINRKALFGHWKDVAVKVTGEAVRSFTLMFLQMWNVDEKQPDWSPCREAPPPAAGAEGYVMPYADCPFDEDKVGENVYIDMLYRAGSYVHIMSPYLILDGELETALRYAAQRGIDVKLILPGIPDKKLAYALAKSHYRRLLEAGVGIYEYTPGFVHAKVFVSDGCRAVTGTINLDYRSLYHHFECATYMYRTPCIEAIEADFEQTLALCRAVTEETIRDERLFYKLAGSLLKIVAPLL